MGKPGLAWIISLILCMPKVLLSTGMLEKVWKKENSQKPVRTWLLLRRTTKKLVWIPSKVKMKEKNIKPNNQNLRPKMISRYYFETQYSEFVFPKLLQLQLFIFPNYFDKHLS